MMVVYCNSKYNTRCIFIFNREDFLLNFLSSFASMFRPTKEISNSLPERYFNLPISFVCQRVLYLYC